jgi:hypothetical protein
MRENRKARRKETTWKTVAYMAGRDQNGSWETDGDWRVEWIQLVQDRDRRRALVNTMMNLRLMAPRSWLVGQSVS